MHRNDPRGALIAVPVLLFGASMPFVLDLDASPHARALVLWLAAATTVGTTVAIATWASRSRH